MTDLGILRDHQLTVQRRGGWWIGWAEDVPGVNAQERSHEKLLESLRVVLEEAVEMDAEKES